MSLNTHKILDLRDVDKSALEAQCCAYAETLSYWNSITNLVSTGDVDNLLVNLINESITLLQHEELEVGSRVLDIGSGAGIPAFPLKFARPDLNMTLIEARRMKAAFLRRVVDELSLQNVTVIHDRIGAEFKMPSWVGQFDMITSRGVGQTVKLFNYLRPFLRTGGSICFFKGSSVSKDAEALRDESDAEIRIHEVSRSISLLVVQPDFER
ncbi:16S rRNA (guanine(527)-N(7))-methyltransferase RsmG [bacterium]|nr:16S rRNA (guanine(527)-N(7))-methyltransferase RsmG [bacterium]